MMRAPEPSNAGASASSSGADRARPRLGLLGRWDIWALACAHAALCVVILPPFDLWPLAFVTPFPLAMLALRAPTMRSALLPLLVSQMAAWLWLFRWIIPVTAVGYPFLGLYETAHTLLMVWALRRVAFSPHFARVPMTVLLPLIWTASEFFRGEVAFDGYPWYMLGHPLINWLAFAQSSDLFGAYFISLLSAIPAGIAMDLMRSGRKARSGSSFVRPGVVTGIALAALLANVVYGHWRMRQTATLAPGPRILAIQTNLPQDNKMGWTLQQQARDIPGFMHLTREAVHDVGGREAVDLIVWPETMVPSLGFDEQTRRNIGEFGPDLAHLTRWVDAVEALSREFGVPMLVGSEAWVGTYIENTSDGRIRLKRDKEYNSAFLIQGEPPYQRYDKAVLTPYGETMPYVSDWPWLEKQMLAFGAGGMEFNLDENPEIRVLRLGAADDSARAYIFGTPICFEDTVPWLCRKMAYTHEGSTSKRADAFVNISNDGWFNASAADRRYHAQIARFRCIENRLPMVRCVNTGMSVHIDSCGRLVAAAGGDGYGVANQAGWVLANVEVDARVTLFGRIGNALPATCVWLVFFMLAATFVRRRAPAAQNVQES